MCCSVAEDQVLVISDTVSVSRITSSARSVLVCHMILRHDHVRQWERSKTSRSPMTLLAHITWHILCSHWRFEGYSWHAASHATNQRMEFLVLLPFPPSLIRTLLSLRWTSKNLLPIRSYYYSTKLQKMLLCNITFLTSRAVVYIL